MKAKLLKKLRAIGRGQITVYSITKTNGYISGMSYGHPGGLYRNLFSLGDSENDVKEKACNIWLYENAELIRNKYKKYTRKYKTQNR